MTRALSIVEKDWLTVKGAMGTPPKPFEQQIELGDYQVLGLLHLDDPALKFHELGDASEMSLRIGTNNSCDIMRGNIIYGWLPKREGAIFVKLMRGGKRLVAFPVTMSTDGLEPTMTVKVKMEEF